MVTPPDYSGGSLVNLVAELENRLGGRPAMPGLHPDLAAAVPDAETYVLLILDGLGDVQLAHPGAQVLAESRRGAVDTVFPSTTTVALASIATGLPPSRHGLLGYQLWLPEADTVVNTIKWTTLWGEPVDYPFRDLLPGPNLWERLVAAGREPVTVQPGHFAGTPLSKVLYRGCRYEPVFTMEEVVTTTVGLATEPGRLIMTYLPHVDFAAHVSGQRSEEYAEALAAVAGVWTEIARRLPADVAMVGTADHGHIDFARHQHVVIPKPAHQDRVFYGDPRAMFVRGEGDRLAARLGVDWMARADMEHWWGPAPHHDSFADRAPDGVLLPKPDQLLLHRFSDERLIGNHGGLTEAERRVPLLVAS